MPILHITQIVSAHSKHVKRTPLTDDPGIITSSPAAAETFMSAVDSAGVYWNASTRFADGMRYGFGTEVGISTNKIHARGPVGLEGLTIYKYKLRGGGQGIKDYAGPNGRRYLHKSLPIEKS